MRPHYLSLALLLAACSDTAPRPPPSDRFIYPSGLVHREVPGSTQGVLYVASANFDRCFDQGTVIAVNLAGVGPEGSGLPPIGSVTSPEPLRIEQLNVAPEARVFIDSFAGEMAVWERDGKAPRLFVPTRSEDNFLHAIDIEAPTNLACVDPGKQLKDGETVVDLGTTTDDDCTSVGVSLSRGIPGSQDDLPRAPGPVGVAVSEEGNVWVTHTAPADSPVDSRGNYAAYVVRLQGAQLTPQARDFYSLAIPGLPLGSSHAVALGERYAFVTGRFVSRLVEPGQSNRFLIRVLDRTNPDRILDPGLDVGFAALEARGLALTEKDPARPNLPERLYVAVRLPDSLLVVDVQGDDFLSEQPRLTVVGSVPLPDGPTQVKLISRRGLGGEASDLVVVSSSEAGVVSIYDPDVGQLVAQVPVGEPGAQTDEAQPYALAVRQEGNAARIFASNFGDGRVSVIDIPDISRPQEARLVAWLGALQTDEEGTCQEAEQ